MEVRGTEGGVASRDMVCIDIGGGGFDPVISAARLAKMLLLSCLVSLWLFLYC